MRANRRMSPAGATGLAALVVAWTALELYAAGRWGLLADEAYYWVWSRNLAWGYYDQPPLIAAMIRFTTALGGDGELAVRSGAIACGLVAAAALHSFAGDRALWWTWWLAVPPLCGLTLFATPDAPLLAAWALVIAGACAGGRGWLLAGAAAGVGVLAKHPAALVFPLALLGAGPEDWRDRWPRRGALLALLVASPHLAWLLTHDLVTVRFQLGENLAGGHGPGPLGVLRMVGEQVLVATPFVALAGAGWLVAGGAGRDRIGRIAWTTSAPVFLLFAAAAPFGVPEAHWPAAAWIGVGLGLSRATGPLWRLAWWGVGSGLALMGAAFLHTFTPVFTLEHDPVVRLEEGPVLAERLAAWVLPVGATVEEGASQVEGVVAERYQEASLIRYYSGIEASSIGVCGRESQYDMWGDSGIHWYVRPSRGGGPPRCLEGRATPRLPAHRLWSPDERGVVVGPWDLFELDPP